MLQGFQTDMSYRKTKRERENHRKQKTIMSKKTNKEREGRTCWKADTNSAHILQREKTQGAKAALCLYLAHSYRLLLPHSGHAEVLEQTESTARKGFKRTH